MRNLSPTLKHWAGGAPGSAFSFALTMTGDRESLKEQVNLLRKVADDELQRLGPVPGRGPPFLQSGVSPELGMKEGVLMA